MLIGVYLTENSSSYWDGDLMDLFMEQKHSNHFIFKTRSLLINSKNDTLGMCTK